MSARSHSIVLSCTSGIGLLFAAGLAQAQSEMQPGDLCGVGDAVSIMNTLPDLIAHQNDSSLDASSLCQFRTFWEPPQHICFREHEAFVGGTIWLELADSSDFADYLDPSGNPWTPRESVAAMDMTFTVEPADTPFVGFVTPVKAAYVSDSWGSVVWKQAGLLFDGLNPGKYTVTMKWHHPVLAQLPDTPDNPDDYPSLDDFYPITVNFYVLSDDVADTLGRPDGEDAPYAGSVKCPADLP